MMKRFHPTNDGCVSGKGEKRTRIHKDRGEKHVHRYQYEIILVWYSIEIREVEEGRIGRETSP